MSAGNARIGAGFIALVAVWIGVYWLWKPTGQTRVSFADDTGAADAGGPPDGPVGPIVVPVEPGEADGEDVDVRLSGEPPVVEGSTPDPVSESALDQAFDERPFTEYTIRSGDTFEGISRRVFGTVRYAGAIKNANPFLNPRALREGDTILLPLDPENPQGRPEEGEPTDIPTPDFIEYTVVRGDSLSALAQRFYGSLRYAEVIFHANTEVMSSMDDLQIGDVLMIPSRESVLGDDE